MKLIIDIPEEVLTAIQNGEDYRYDIHTTIAQGIPYEPKGDLISREDLKEAYQTGYEEGHIDGMLQAEKLYARPLGEWIYPEKTDKEKGYGGYCSNCKCDMPIFVEDWKQKYCETKFCPNCGAKMKGGKENEDYD